MAPGSMMSMGNIFWLIMAALFLLAVTGLLFSGFLAYKAARAYPRAAIALALVLIGILAYEYHSVSTPERLMERYANGSFLPLSPIGILAILLKLSLLAGLLAPFYLLFKLSRTRPRVAVTLAAGLLSLPAAWYFSTTPTQEQSQMNLETGIVKIEISGQHFDVPVRYMYGEAIESYQSRKWPTPKSGRTHVDSLSLSVLLPELKPYYPEDDAKWKVRGHGDRVEVSFGKPVGAADWFENIQKNPEGEKKYLFMSSCITKTNIKMITARQMEMRYMSPAYSRPRIWSQANSMSAVAGSNPIIAPGWCLNTTMRSSICRVGEKSIPV